MFFPSLCLLDGRGRSVGSFLTGRLRYLRRPLPPWLLLWLVLVLCLLPPLRLMLTEVLRAWGSPFYSGVVAFGCYLFGTLLVGTYLGFNGLYLA